MKRFRAALGAVALLLSLQVSASTSLRFCAQEPERSAAELDRVLQVAATLRQVLEAQGPRAGDAALLARAGTQLGRFGIRYTHAAVSLRENPLAPWGVRQLYFACDERRTRLFDQGLAGFLLGADDPSRGFASLLLLPPEAAATLAAAALNEPQALALLEGEYVANAHPADLSAQNCNQWVAELLAAAWGQGSNRTEAQGQLQRWAYAPEPVAFSPLWRLPAALVPWIRMAGQPAEVLAQNRLVTSLPPDLERLAQRLWPQAERVELCYTPTHWVLRRNGVPLPETCTPEPGDRSGSF